MIFAVDEVHIVPFAGIDLYCISPVGLQRSHGPTHPRSHRRSRTRSINLVTVRFFVVPFVGHAGLRKGRNDQQAGPADPASCNPEVRKVPRLAFAVAHSGVQCMRFRRILLAHEYSLADKGLTRFQRPPFGSTSTSTNVSTPYYQR